MTVIVNEEIMQNEWNEPNERNEENEENEELNALYLELGKAYYEGAFEDPLPQLLPLFDRITEILKADEWEEGCCPNCGAELDEEAKFCEMCGFPVGSRVDTVPDIPKERVCVNCGNVLRESAVFCGKCGTKAE